MAAVSVLLAVPSVPSFVSSALEPEHGRRIHGGYCNQNDVMVM